MTTVHPLPMMIQPLSGHPLNYALPNTNPFLNTNYVLTNTHHPLWNHHIKDTRSSSAQLKAAWPPSAPRLSQVDPLAALWVRSRGPPPEYATIDPRKLRARYLRPIFTRRSSTLNKKSQGSSKDRSKLSGTGRSRQRPVGQLA